MKIKVGTMVKFQGKVWCVQSVDGESYPETHLIIWRMENGCHKLSNRVSIKNIQIAEHAK